jgi:hypothetical protein
MSNATFLKPIGKKNNFRRYKGGGPRPDHNEYKQKEAIERDIAWRAKTPAEQLAALDARLGEGVGATKQRARIEAQIAAARKAAPITVPTGAERLKAKERRAQERAKRPAH